MPLLSLTASLGCSVDAASSDGAAPDAGALADATVPAAADLSQGPDLAIHVPSQFCDQPGSVRWGQAGYYVMPGGAAGWPDLTYLRLPAGFCAHFFANVPNVRQLRFAPGGELFVASPSRTTASGGPGGRAEIIILPDDDSDRLADAPIVFLDQLPATQGLLFAKDHLYYQNLTKIMRVPYQVGDRAPSASPELVANITSSVSELHWPKVLDMADDGSIYVTNGGDEGEHCDPVHVMRGGLFKLDNGGGTIPIARGLRNPIALRCPPGHNRCFALELARDYSTDEGGREKLIPVHAGDDWGYPCCATRNLPYMDIMPVPDCSGIVPEFDSFIIGDTPFSLDFEMGHWPMPWTGSAFVVLHGSNGLWKNMKLVSIAMDPQTGTPLPAVDGSGHPTGAMRDFAAGWDLLQHQNGRPTSLVFAPDGRLFLSNDSNGDIVWISVI